MISSPFGLGHDDHRRFAVAGHALRTAGQRRAHELAEPASRFLQLPRPHAAPRSVQTVQNLSAHNGRVKGSAWRLLTGPLLRPLNGSMVARSFDQGGCVMRSRAVILAAAMSSRRSAQGRRPRGVVGGGLLRGGGRGGPGDRSPPSSRRPASRSSSFSHPRTSGIWPTSWRRSRPGGPPRTSSHGGWISHAERWAYEDRLVDLT